MFVFILFSGEIYFMQDWMFKVWCDWYFVRQNASRFLYSCSLSDVQLLKDFFFITSHPCICLYTNISSSCWTFHIFHLILGVGYALPITIQCYQLQPIEYLDANWIILSYWDYRWLQFLSIIIYIQNCTKNIKISIPMMTNSMIIFLIMFLLFLCSLQQGAHLAALAAIIGIGIYFLPTRGYTSVMCRYMLYLAAFGISFGTQFWMTFVNGKFTIEERVPFQIL